MDSGSAASHCPFFLFLAPRSLRCFLSSCHLSLVDLRPPLETICATILFPRTRASKNSRAARESSSLVTRWCTVLCVGVPDIRAKGVSIHRRFGAVARGRARHAYFPPRVVRAKPRFSRRGGNLRPEIFPPGKSAVVVISTASSRNRRHPAIGRRQSHPARFYAFSAKFSAFGPFVLLSCLDETRIGDSSSKSHGVASSSDTILDVGVSRVDTIPDDRLRKIRRTHVRGMTRKDPSVAIDRDKNARARIMSLSVKCRGRRKLE